MTGKSKRTDSANYGIIGDVKANAVAVGPDAHAVSNHTATFARDDFEAAVSELRDQVAKLSISEHEMAALRTDLEKLKQLGAAQQLPPDRGASMLDGLVTKLKTLGVVVEAVKPLAEPIRAIAAMCGIPLPF